eukprot:GFUD01031606.1.p1 GENE.GFUD01031606.1~~GFUD01031606.1.p1  ORF type:complete len:256 (-),score=71.26 GFUD01031606.1:219-986(-)
MLKFLKNKGIEMNNNKSEESTDTQAPEMIITITITDTEDSELPENQLEAVFKQFENLRKANTDFVQFLTMVRTDLITKSEGLKKMKTSPSRNEKTYASVQLFMLSQYKQRMNNFENVSRNSMEDISRKHHSDIKVDDCVANHINILVKMKRRMKQMIDVSEKYSVVDMFDTVNNMSELCEEMDPSLQDKESRLCKSLLSLDTVLEDSTLSSRFRTESESMSKTADNIVPTFRKKKTFKALTDHLIVITKTFKIRK